MADYSQIEKLVYEAGQMLLHARLNTADIGTKQDAADFCTQYDVKLQQFLMDGLSAILPQAGFYGEEDTEGNRESLQEKEYIFYIDPIDGTTNFVFDYDHSCVSVALVKKGQPVAGFVYDPYAGKFYKAFLDGGSYLNGQRLTLADRSVAQGIVAFGCARHKPEGVSKTFRAVEALFSKCLGIRSGGSATLALCRVASGSNVAFLEPQLEPYDYAAAMLIVAEAGGRVTQMDGTPLSLTGSSSVICGTPKAWQEVKQLL